MRPLESFRKNYFYDDWDEVVQSTLSAQEVLNMPSTGQEADKARHRWAGLLAQGALFKRTRWINWRVAPDAYPLSQDILEQLTELGTLVDSFLQGVDRCLGENAFFRETLGFPTCPEEEILWQHHRGDPLAFFRLDLTFDQTGMVKLLEIQVVMGGLGITQALRSIYGPHKTLAGTAASYERSVLNAYNGWCKRRKLRPPEKPLVAVIGARNSKYRHDHLVLARHVPQLEMAVSPLNLLDFDSSGRPTLPDGRIPHIIHRLFRSPSLFQKNPEKALCLMDSIKRKQVFMANPWKDFLEDKRVLALVKHPRVKQNRPEWLESAECVRLRRFIPCTRLADAPSITELLGRPRSERTRYLKKGRSFESRDLCDGQQVNLRQWDAACLRARREGDWIIQNAVYGRPQPFRYLEFQAQEIRSMQGYIRLNPFYFRTQDKRIVLGDILITAREERSRIHGASDAILLVPCTTEGAANFQEAAEEE